MHVGLYNFLCVTKKMFGEHVKVPCATNSNKCKIIIKCTMFQRSEFREQWTTKHGVNKKVPARKSHFKMKNGVLISTILK